MENEVSASQLAIAAKQNIKEREYWLKKLSGELGKSNFPYDFKINDLNQYNKRNIKCKLPDELFSAIMKLSKGFDAGLHIILVTGLSILLSKYCGNSDIMIGSPILKQARECDFINTILVFRNQPVPVDSFKELLLQVKDTIIEANKNQNYPMTELLNHLDISNADGGFPLFDVAILLENLHDKNFLQPIHHNMTFSFLKTGESIEGAVEYNACLYHEKTIKQIIRHYIHVLEQALSKVDIKIAQIGLLSEEERKQVLDDFNHAYPDTASDCLAGKTLHLLLEEQAVSTPDNTAVIGMTTEIARGKIHLTYQEFDLRAAQVAKVLKDKGVGPDCIVSVMEEFTIEMMVSLIAILKAGGAYLPLVADHPGERTRYIIEDSGAQILLTTRDYVKIYENTAANNDKKIEILNIEECRCAPGYVPQHLPRRSPEQDPGTLAYLIYTSGTTGKPKGVMVEHRNVTSYLHAYFQEFRITPADTIIQLASYFFDVFVEEVFPILLRGGKILIPAPFEIMDIDALARLIVKHQVSIIDCTPLLLNEFNKLNSPGLPGNPFKNIHIFISGGDVLKREYVQNLLKNGRVYNTYGPTESTVCATYYQLPPPPRAGNPAEPGLTLNVPIGKPIANYKVYILDNNHQPVPIGIDGEISITGPGVTRGYLNQPELTAEKFLHMSHIPYMSYMSYISYMPGRSYFYKTGDRARWLPDGNIEFLGRKDDQIKIRGYRIETGEIEKQLIKLKPHNIDEAIVIAKENEAGEKFLCAYIITKEEFELSGLRNSLADELPEYMIPSFFIPIRDIPLTPNGKIDKKALPEPTINTGIQYVEPQNQTQRQMQKLWQEVLGYEPIGINDNFFRIGGHSLKGIQLINEIHKEFNVKVPLAGIFTTPTIKELCLYIKEAGEEQFLSIEALEKKEYYGLSSAQKRLYILQQLEPGSTGYNMSMVIRLEKDTDINTERLEWLVKKLMERHEALRTTFLMINEEPVQKVRQMLDIPFTIDIYQVDASREKETIKNCVRPFDLSQVPIFRAAYLEIATGERTIFLDIHHILTDGTSIDILQKELFALDSGEELAPLRIHYKDFSQWQNREKKKESIKQQKLYWLELLAGELPVPELPTDYTRPLMQSFEGNFVYFTFNQGETQTLKQAVQETGATLYMVILSLWSLLLGKLSGQEDIIVGTPIAGRRHSDLKEVIGMFANTLAMRTFPSLDLSFKELILQVKDMALKAYDNQDYQFEDLVEDISAQRDTSRNPIFDVMFNLLNQGDFQGYIPPQLKENVYEHREGSSKFDLNLTAVDRGEQILLIIEYCTRLYKPKTIERFIGYLKNIVSVLSEVHPGLEVKLGQVEIITRKEKEKILEMSWGTEEIYAEDETIQQLFEKQSSGTPDHIALTGPMHEPGARRPFNSVQLTYRQLNEKTNTLAQYLRKKGIKRDTVVGLMVERSGEMIIAILAILKAGGAYLPIDAEYPRERKKYMLEDSGVKLLLTDNASDTIPGNFSGDIEMEMIDPRDQHFYKGNCINPTHINRGADLLYVIYTSGSTGKPKGVMLEHRNLVNLLEYQFKYTNIDCSRMLQFATISFDASFHEIFSALLSGGVLYLINQEMRSNIAELFNYIEENDIKTLFLPMSFLRMVFNEDEFISIFPHSVTHIQTAGEQVIINDKLRRYLEENHVYLHNHYGPAESHVVTTLTIGPEGDIPALPSIGKPVMNTNIYILDKGMNLIPVRVVGELYIGGIQVGRGYLKREQLTLERFIESPFGKEDRLYKTGDLSRWLEDENIEFIGRIDQQVKIRGFRVELEEVESHLSNHQDIKEAVVSALSYETGEKYLCAYIVSEGTLEIAGLREYLGKSLPDYMIPSYFVSLEKIPLNPNGKIDRKALPLPGLKAGEEYTAPRDEIEEKMVTLWSDVLAVEREVIGIDKNFFELGGQSLKATVLVARIHKAFNVKVPLAAIFKTPTVRKISRYIKTTRRERYASIKSLEKKKFYALSSAQKRLYILQQLEMDSPAYNMLHTIPFQDEPDIKKLEQVFLRLIEHHESFRTSFHVVNDEPVQKVHEKVEFKIEYFELVNPQNSAGIETAGNRVGSTDLPVVTRDWLTTHYRMPFDLSRAPLSKVGIVKTGEARYILVTVMHHIISDGVSLEILTKDFMTLYAGKELPPLCLQYKDFSEWQNKEKQKEYIKQQEQYWLRQFEDKIPGLDLSSDYPRPSVQLFKGSTLFDEISCDIDALRAIALENKATTFILLLAIFNIFLSKVTGQEDIVVGTPVAGRRHSDLEGIMGIFVNSLALRNKPKVEKTFMEFLKGVRGKTLDAFENQDYQFEDLVEKLTVDRNRHNPLFDVFFTCRDQGPDTANPTGIIAEKTEESTNQSQNSPPDQPPNESEPGTSKFDLYLNIFIGEKLHLTFEYSTELFRRETIAAFARGFKEIVLSVLKDKNIKLEDIRMTTGILDSDLSGVTQELTTLEF
jgi:amino acid adenylation domain-containing protein